MKRHLVALGLATAIVIPAATGEAQAARQVSPIAGAACKPQPPVVLGVGARPRAALRISLAANAHRSGTQFDTERVQAKTFAPDGSIVPRNSTQQRKGVYTTGRPAHLDLGSDTTAAGVVRYRLVSLRGSATGTMRLPLANALGGTWSTRTTASVVFNATPAHAQSIAIHTSFVDTETIGPTG